MTVDTRKIKDRRLLRFQSFAEAIADAESLAVAEQQRALRATGNWTLGQAIGHVATGARFGVEGFPEIPRPPRFVRLIAPLLKSRFLNKGLPAGAKLGDLPGGAFGIEQIATDKAVRELRESFGRLNRQVPTLPHVFFGKLSHEEWIKFHLRHAELHFSFFHLC